MILAIYSLFIAVAADLGNPCGIPDDAVSNISPLNKKVKEGKNLKQTNDQ